MAASSKSQRNLPPMELRDPEQPDLAFRTSEQDAPVAGTFRNSEQDELALRESEQFAAHLLDVAFRDAGLENKDVAFFCGVSTSLVEKWRSTEQRGCPSFVQMLLLPPAFHIALHRRLNKRYGFGRSALKQLLDAAGDLAMVVGE
jgi:hypothetical protein